MLFCLMLTNVHVCFSSLEVLVTLTTDVGKVLTCLHKVQPKGDAHFLTGVKKAHVRELKSCIHGHG